MRGLLTEELRWTGRLVPNNGRFSYPLVYLRMGGAWEKNGVTLWMFVCAVWLYFVSDYLYMWRRGRALDVGNASSSGDCVSSLVVTRSGGTRRSL
jgi:hypothetical protein